VERAVPWIVGKAVNPGFAGSFELERPDVTIG